MGIEKAGANRRETERDIHLYFDTRYHRDATIVAWLAAMAPRQRQEAIRNALYAHVRQQQAEEPHPPRRSQVGPRPPGGGEEVEPFEL
jgi:hypothetical protein